jgi:hypothetical protein
MRTAGPVFTQKGFTLKQTSFRRAFKEIGGARHVLRLPAVKRPLLSGGGKPPI